MKKIMLISAMSFFLFNCESNDENTEVQQSGLNERVAIGKITTYHDDGNTWGCWGSPTDCLPEVIVTPNKVSFTNTIVPLMDAVMKENSNLVKEIFTVRSSDLLDYFEQDIINQAANGNLELKIKTKAGTKDHYFIFEDNNKNIKRVYPIFE